MKTSASWSTELNQTIRGQFACRLIPDFSDVPRGATPPKTAYIVWLRERDGNASPQGQLRVDKKLNGSFQGVTPAKNFDVFITAEQETAPKAPTGDEILKATVQP